MHRQPPLALQPDPAAVIPLTGKAGGWSDRDDGVTQGPAPMLSHGRLLHSFSFIRESSRICASSLRGSCAFLPPGDDPKATDRSRGG